MAESERNLLETDPKPSVFDNIVDFGKKPAESECEMAIESEHNSSEIDPRLSVFGNNVDSGEKAAESECEMTIESEHNLSEIDPKPSVFDNIVDSGDKVAESEREMAIESEHNLSEIHPKPSVFDSNVDSGEKAVESECEMAIESEYNLSEIDPKPSGFDSNVDSSEKPAEFECEMTIESEHNLSEIDSKPSGFDNIVDSGEKVAESECEMAVESEQNLFVIDTKPSGFNNIVDSGEKPAESECEMAVVSEHNLFVIDTKPSVFNIFVHSGEKADESESEKVAEFECEMIVESEYKKTAESECEKGTVSECSFLEIDSKNPIYANIVYSDEKTVFQEDFLALEDIPEASNTVTITTSNAITPKPGICVKVKSDKNEKVFINICHHSDVPHPRTLVNIDAITNGHCEPLLQFPISFAEVRTEKDKSGNDCKCYDVLINSDYFNKEILRKRHRDFILNLSSLSLKHRYDISVEIASYRILTKKYHCQMHEHVIKLEDEIGEMIGVGENMSEDRYRVILDPYANMISSLIESGAKYSDLKDRNILDYHEARLQFNEFMSDVDKMQELFESTTIVRIRPNEGICAKTKSDKDEKIFINLCHHHVVPPPTGPINLEAILKKQAPMVYPLSAGDLRNDKDKSGNECKCYDIVVNTDFYNSDVTKNNGMRDYLLILACSIIERNYAIAPDVASIKVLGKTYHGEMPDHYIRFVVMPEADERMCLDDILLKEDIIKVSNDSSQPTPYALPTVNDWSILPKLIGETTILVFQGSVTNVSDKRDIAVYLSKREITIEDKKGNTVLKAPIPSEYTISPQKGMTNLWNKRLTIAMPLESGDKA